MTGIALWHTGRPSTTSQHVISLFAFFAYSAIKRKLRTPLPRSSVVSAIEALGEGGGI